MPLSWNEIKDRALKFSCEWQHESSRDAEAKSFSDGFFDVFGVSRLEPISCGKIGRDKISPERTSRLRPNPHPSLRATFSHREKGSSAAPPSKPDSDAERVAFLFERHQQLASLLPSAKAKTICYRVAASKAK